ncbi:MAG TPA: acetate--CoA ligase family protein [Longimicrobiales bacterium]|nr:acetate--CoA ligase family protein [Longimicrobiales bacterium]
MTRRSLDPIFAPRSIAVIGASRTPGTIGYQIIDNLVRHRYQGAVYPVNPRASAIHSIRAYPSVEAIPDPVDLAVVVVPKEHVLAVVDQCGAKEVPALVVISAGFKEVGGAGVERERQLVERVRRYGMRLVGPNCMGVLNTDAEWSMNATFAPTMPPRGPVSFMSQSGAMGVTILDYAAEYGIGIHHFASVGNKPDVSGNDLIEYWAEDPRTRVILMYLENFGNPRKFTHIARKVTKETPIVVVKAGRTGAGARAASSHTGALAGLDVATDALLSQCGVLRVDTVGELFDMAMAFGTLPVPAGNRVAIITNAGGPGIIIADACESAGLVVAELSPGTQERLRGAFPEEASVKNPVDMIASATPDGYRVALEAVLEDEHIDAAIAAFVPPLGIRQQDVAEAIVAARHHHPEKPVLAVLMGREGLPQGRAELAEAGVPAYIFPESAARALAALYRHRRWLERPAGTVRRFEVDRDAAASILEGAAAEGREHLTGDEALAVLGAYGIPTVQRRLATTAADAVEAARAVGFPVVLKVASADVVHKSDVGGVRLDVRSAEEVEEGWHAIMAAVRAAAPDAQVDGVAVEQYARGGRETIIGMSVDPAFGPLLMFGLGGIYVEVLKDVAFRVQPVSDVDARDMVRAIRGYRLLEGVRGEPPADVTFLEEMVQRISQLVGEHPEIAELDVNPLLALPGGGVAVDARIRLAAPARREQEGGRALEAAVGA